MPEAEIQIVGGGIVGLSIALELRMRGAEVVVLERPSDRGKASIAAAGMLAAEDPQNPPELLELSLWSLSLYERYLKLMEFLSGKRVPFQTQTTRQYDAAGIVREIAEQSVDPRQLFEALRAATLAVGAVICEGNASVDATVVYASGAWFAAENWVAPRKGQMLRVAIPEGRSLIEVYRAEDVYVVPRTAGPQQGTALIGATVEDAGFDVETRAEDLRILRRKAARLLPWIGDEYEAPMVEAWAGLRSATTDGLPVLGAMPGSEREFVALGHFRNGILLAPATAVVMANSLEGVGSPVALGAFHRSDLGIAQLRDKRPLTRDNSFLILR